MKDCCYRVVEIKVYAVKQRSQAGWKKKKNKKKKKKKMKRKVGFTVLSHIRTVVVYR